MSHVYQVVLRKALTNYARKYLRPRSGTLTELTIDYILEYGVFAIDVQIRNLDAAATMQYSVNSRGDLETIPAGGTQVITNTIIETLRLVGNAATGDWEVSHMGIPYEDLVR